MPRPSTARAWMQAWFTERKRARGGYTLARLARDLGVTSAGHARMVLGGKRRITLAQIHRIARRMHLAPREHRIWEAMVLRDQSDSAADRRYYTAILREFGQLADRRVATATGGQPLEAGDLDALVRLHGRTAEQAGVGAETLGRLRSAGLLEPGSGGYRMCATQVDLVDPESKTASLRRILGKSLRDSAAAFRADYGRGAKFYAQVGTFTEDQAERVRAEIERLLEASAAISDETPDPPYGPLHALNVQFFRK